MYRSNHLESQNAGQDSAGLASTAQNSNHSLSFSSAMRSNLEKSSLEGAALERREYAAPPQLPLQQASMLPPQLPSAQYPTDRSDLPNGKSHSEPDYSDGPPASGIDLQISALFTAMGRASKMSRQQLAARLQTTPELISALETGTLNALPEWEDIAPIIARYASFMNIDERPILRRLREQLTEHFLTEMTRNEKINRSTAPQLGYSSSSMPGANSMPDTSFMPESYEQSSHSFAGHSIPDHTNELHTHEHRTHDHRNSEHINTERGLKGDGSLLPSTDQTLKALARGQVAHERAPASHPAGGPVIPSIEERFTALASAVSHSQQASFSTGQGAGQDTGHDFGKNDKQAYGRDLNSGMSRGLRQSGLSSSHERKSATYQNGHALNSLAGNSLAGNAVASQGQMITTQSDYRSDNRGNSNLMGHSAGAHNSQMQMHAAHNNEGGAEEAPKSKGRSIMLRVVGNLAFVIILLVGFINWQPNRFWSGVDQLPKPISETIYSLFEIVMPDPLASVYRMNWVRVDDPRMRKADKLAVPVVKKLPAIDFSKLGILPK